MTKTFVDEMGSSYKLIKQPKIIASLTSTILTVASFHAFIALNRQKFIGIDKMQLFCFDNTNAIDKSTFACVCLRLYYFLKKWYFKALIRNGRQISHCRRVFHQTMCIKESGLC